LKREKKIRYNLRVNMIESHGKVGKRCNSGLFLPQKVPKP
jgi:hypothetical protein